MRWFIVSGVTAWVWISACGLAKGADQAGTDRVLDRLQEHIGAEHQLPVRVVGEGNLPTDTTWSRVRHLVAFRVHRHAPDGTTRVDREIYIVRTSKLYRDAERFLRQSATTREYIWCLLAAVLAHESAHTAPRTERQALEAEVEQLRRCLSAGHLFTNSGWNALEYLGKVEKKMKNPREHY